MMANSPFGLIIKGLTDLVIRPDVRFAGPLEKAGWQGPFRTDKLMRTNKNAQTRQAQPVRQAAYDGQEPFTAKLRCLLGIGP
jgi:hypothetical protein